MSFQISPELDRNRVFLVKSSELEGRFDAHFHKPEFKKIEQAINSGRWRTSKLKDLFQINRGGSPRPINNYLTDDESGVNWIKIGDTKGVDKYIFKTKQKIKPEGAKFSRKVVEGDFVLSNSMSFGKPFIMKTSGYIHDGWLLFRGITNSASKDYLHAVLGMDFVYKLFKKQTIGGVVENLNIDLVENVKIPIPPKDIQAEIVAKMDDAYALKKKKEEEAEALLASIDEVLLKELGIPPLPEKKNTLKDRIFTRKFSEVSGSRLDPSASQKRIVDIKNRVNRGEFSTKRLHHVVSFEKEKTSNITSHDVYIGLENICGMSGNYLESSTAKESISSASVFKEGQILFPKLRPYLNKPHLCKFEGLCSTEFHVLSAKEVFPEYLIEYLRSKMIVSVTSELMTGNTLPRLQTSDIERLHIPIPDKATQSRIIEQSKIIRKSYQSKKREAKEVVENAKKEIEEMILGKEAGV